MDAKSDSVAMFTSTNWTPSQNLMQIGAGLVAQNAGFPSWRTHGPPLRLYFSCSLWFFSPLSWQWLSHHFWCPVPIYIYGYYKFSELIIVFFCGPWPSLLLLWSCHHGFPCKDEEINPIKLPWNILQENKQINITMRELEEILAELLQI